MQVLSIENVMELSVVPKQHAVEEGRPLLGGRWQNLHL